MPSSNLYMAAYMLRRYHARRALAIERLGGRCVRCKAADDLQFPASKTLDVAKMWSVSQKRFDAEIAKCQLLCGPCHSLKSIHERGQRVAKGQHGRPSCARYCKCGACLASTRAYSRAYRQRQKIRGCS